MIAASCETDLSEAQRTFIIVAGGRQLWNSTYHVGRAMHTHGVSSQHLSRLPAQNTSEVTAAFSNRAMAITSFTTLVRVPSTNNVLLSLTNITTFIRCVLTHSLASCNL
jgi:adenylate cyclase